MMRYNIHGISPPVLVWIFGHFHYTKYGDSLCYFYLQIAAKNKSAV